MAFPEPENRVWSGGVLVGDLVNTKEGSHSSQALQVPSGKLGVVKVVLEVTS